jgi:hypothetical protein
MGSSLARIPCRQLNFRSGGQLSSHSPDLKHQGLFLQSRQATHRPLASFFHIFAPKINFKPFRNSY